MFSGSGKGGQPASKSVGSKPFIITETASTIHLWVVEANNTINRGTNVLPGNSAEDRVKIKQAWWRQIINATFIQQFPRFHALTFFEFIKFEETTWRDFTSLGKGTNLTSPFGNDGGDLDRSTLAAFQAEMAGDMGKLIKWGNIGNPKPKSGAPSRTSTNKSFAFDLGIPSIIIAVLFICASAL